MSSWGPLTTHSTLELAMHSPTTGWNPCWHEQRPRWYCLVIFWFLSHFSNIFYCVLHESHISYRDTSLYKKEHLILFASTGKFKWRVYKWLLFYSINFSNVWTFPDKTFWKIKKAANLLLICRRVRYMMLFCHSGGRSWQHRAWCASLPRIYQRSVGLRLRKAWGLPNIPGQSGDPSFFFFILF